MCQNHFIMRTNKLIANTPVYEFALNSKLTKTGADAILVSSPEGYSPLGLLRNELSEEEQALERLGQFCEQFNKLTDFSICAFELFPGIHILLAPNQNSIYYQNNAPGGNSIWSEFAFASTFCSLVLASHLGVKKLAITHILQGVDNLFITSMMDAIKLYYSRIGENTTTKIIFSGCCFEEAGLEAIVRQELKSSNQQYPDFTFSFEKYESMTRMKIRLDYKL